MTILTANKQDCISHCDTEKEKAGFAFIENIELNPANDKCPSDELIEHLIGLKSAIVALHKAGSLDLQMADIPCIRYIHFEFTTPRPALECMCVDKGVIEYAAGRLDWYKEIAEDITEAMRKSAMRLQCGNG